MLSSVVNEIHPAGLMIHLANTPGGSAPVLYTSRWEEQYSIDAPNS